MNESVVDGSDRLLRIDGQIERSGMTLQLLLACMDRAIGGRLSGGPCTEVRRSSPTGSGRSIIDRHMLSRDFGDNTPVQGQALERLKDL